MVRCLPACCGANRRQSVSPPFTSAFGPGVHVLSGGVGDGKTPVAVSPGGGMDGLRLGRPQRQRRARVRKGPRSPSGPRPLRLRRQGPVTVAGELHAICGRSEGMSVRGRTMARGGAAFRKEEICTLGCRGHSTPAGPAALSRPPAGAAASRAGNGPWGPPTPAGPPGAAARGSVETGRDLRAAPAQGGWRTWGRRAAPAQRGEREPEPGQGEADSPPDIPFC